MRFARWLHSWMLKPKNTVSPRESHHAELIHLDVSNNAIPKGLLLPSHLRNPGQILCDENTLVNNGISLEQQISLQSLCQYSPILYSHLPDTISQKSLLFPSDNPNERLHPNQALIAIMAYPLNVSTLSGGHAFIVIERLISEFGQREYLQFELFSTDDGIKIVLQQTTPQKLLHTMTRIDDDCTSHGFVHSDLINTFIENCFHHRNTQRFMDYQQLPNKSSQQKQNCITWATIQLNEIGIPIDIRNTPNNCPVM